MKQAFFFPLFLLTLSPAAQKPSVDEVLNVEKNFAAYSVTHGAKEAFLKFLDSTGVVFEKGKVVNGIKSWSKKEKSTGILNWHPVQGGVALSGDFGFTTGPWTFQEKTIEDSVVAQGQYSTVWKKGYDGQWKFIVDIGVSGTPGFPDSVYSFAVPENKFVPGNWNNLLNKEQNFIKQTKAVDSIERTKAYRRFVSNERFFLNRNGQLPATRGEDLPKTVRSMPQKIDYTINGSGISDAGDLGYVYGTTLINGNTDNYLRIWRREGKEWKLALEVLRY